MASDQETKLSLKLWVDNERNSVVVAEASGDLIDTLFSFLTLPLGTIIRLVSNKQGPEPDEAKVIGCINNLYQSVEGSGDEVFWNKICKRMLLSPRNPCEDLCQKLKLKVDDTEPMKYFMCSNKCQRRGYWVLSTFAEASCSCGKLMNKEMKLSGNSNEGTRRDGVFVKGETMFLIFDDLRVLQSSLGNSVQQLAQLGYKNLHNLTEKSLNVGLDEILDIFKQALTSTSPLSDVLLGNEEYKKVNCTFSPKLRQKNQGYFHSGISLKVTVRKSKKAILYAEAGGDFVDFLFSFLTTPLGCILKLLDGNICMGCMNNLYKSVKDLNPSWFTESSGTTPLLNLRVAPQFGCERQPTQLCQENIPNYWYGTRIIRNNVCYANLNGVISKEHNLIIHPSPMEMFEPRSLDGTRESCVGFVRRPSLFVVWDDLQVTPLANTSSISLLQRLNVPLDDLEVHELRLEEIEALNLLGASLTSKAALTEGLFHLLKKLKEETKA